ncbi:hypothetical protein ES703_50746 [subsurface metagenome]
MKRTQFTQLGIWDNYKEHLWEPLICSVCSNDRVVRHVWSKLPDDSDFSFHKLCLSCKSLPEITLE